MNYKLLHELIDHLEKFDQEKKTDSVEDFRIWLNEKHYESQSPKFISEQEKHQVFDLENEIAKQVILLGRFSKQMIRRGLQDFPQLANEEFTYLFRLVNEPDLTKMQLVEKNAHEKQTGMEIIKRLVKNGLVKELSDESDKRIKRLQITSDGKEMFEKSLQDVTVVSRVLSAKLSDNEKDELLRLLKKLNEFHFTIYHEHKTSDIGAINSLI